MARTRTASKLLAAGTLSVVGQVAAALPPAPTAADMAKSQPAYPGVAVSTPAPADVARCRVEPVPNPQNTAAGPIGHALIDANNRLVRRFLAVGTANYNIMSFYLDGQEVYRETDGNGNGKPDQFRWLGANGSKWGLDPQETGRVTNWAKISPEEVSREMFEAIVAKDAKRVEALTPTDEELKSLGLPAAEVAKVRQRTAGVAAKVAAAAAALNLSEKAKWVHLELTPPQTTPADAFGGTQDIVRYKNAGVLVDRGDNKAEFFQTGELVQIGPAWRVIDGPTAGSPQPTGPGGDDAVDVPEPVRALVADLGKIKAPDDAAGMGKYHAERAAVLEQIVAKLQGHAQQEAWLKQLLDAYASAAESGQKPAAERLAQWKTQIDKVSPKSAAAAFAGFRHMSVEYAAKMAAATDPKDVGKVQTWWKESLEAFAKDFPATDETPEALFRLAMAHEFGGRDGEAAAKVHYGRLAKDFPQHALAGQAAGAVRRLDSDGQPFALAGTTLAGQAVDVAGLKGNVTIVYFWASWSRQLKEEGAALGELAKKYKGLNVVTVCMDADAKAAAQAAQAAQLPGVHLFAPGNALATQYGVMGPHVFLVDKAGKVANKNAQVPLLADEIEKLVK